MIGGAENSTQIKVETRPHKEQQEQRRAEVIQLLKKPFVVGDIDVNHRHGHTAQ